MKKALLGIILLITIAAGVLYVKSPLRPVNWYPDATIGLNNMFSPNTALSAVTIYNRSALIGPEDIYVSDDGIAYTGLANGAIVSFPVSSPNNSRVIANTGGRPLGIRGDNEGNLIVSDPIRGLLSVSLGGRVNVLVNSFEGAPLRLIDHHDIAENGDIYFSNASSRFGIDDYLHDFLEASATGSIYRYSPESGETNMVMSGIFFANGVAVGPNDEFLLVAETGKSRILKYHLKGKRKGETSIFANNLPAMPDNISFNGTDTFWVGMVSLRDWRVEALAAFPAIRRMLGALPMEWLEPKEGYGFVLGFDIHGNVVANYQSPNVYNTVTAAYEHNGNLYLGSLHSNGVAVLSLGR
ncbi:strictosidine synthase family protein [Glaciecola siphonariae]|uniref:Strictosidine synthase family protein n=1 Tax=Glaciecola siphonariae TaxID=521012 RepID=A0ABV9LZC9_9ALTE